MKTCVEVSLSRQHPGSERIVQVLEQALRSQLASG